MHAYSIQERQAADAVLMIRPARFRSNPQTTASNAFQQAATTGDARSVQQLAEQEFAGLVAALEQAGVRVCVHADTRSPDKPDAIFPNNWFSTHGDGTVVVYAMEAANRRLERRADLVADLAEKDGFHVARLIDLSLGEQRDQFLEGTGSLVLDRVHRIAYACRSSRTNPLLLQEWCERLGYEAVLFSALDNGRPIYHTNVMMSIGERLAVICLAAFASDEEREEVRSRLVQTGHEIVEISIQQMNAFAGNVLELLGTDNQSLFVMSQRAYDSLSEAQRERICQYSRIVQTSIPTIEDHAGGSVRCMLAEIFLPRD